ncbi:Uncharacterised protein [Bartonella vinsonii]|uniref:Uncharacterized protein n=1 Tax=Bartonella vinsonii TaxID=33047 RepID=A0A3S4YYR3_BARVI|nr:Uncharacterised protein [Bartonella vinsonii]
MLRCLFSTAWQDIALMVTGEDVSNKDNNACGDYST